MECFDWQLEKSEVLGLIKRPIAEIAIKDSEGEWQPIFLYVDSGADISLIRRSFGELLGIEIEKGRCAKFGGVSGKKIETYIHRVELQIGKFTLETNVAFSKDDTTPNLLGRLGIFETFEIHFKNKTERTCFIREEETDGC